MSDSRRSIQEFWSLREVVYRLLDALCILTSLILAIWLADLAPGAAGRFSGAVGVIVYYLVAEIHGLFRNWRGISMEREIRCLMASWSTTCVLLLALGAAVGYGPPAAEAVTWVWFTLAPLMMCLARLAIRAVQRVLRAQGLNLRNYAIVGVNELAFQLAHNIESTPELGLRFVGFYDDRPESRLPAIAAGTGRRVGNLTDLLEQARARRVDMIYITFPMRAEQRIRGVLDRLGDTTASVYVVPDFSVFELLHSRWTSINGLPVVSVFESPFFGIDGWAKRTLDVVVASVLLIVLSPLMLTIALAIKWTSPGPVFFRQRRYGLDGREFLVWKFRTMRVCEDGAQVKQATRDDPRVTPLGAMLRRTSLDELPQLFNVLQGKMSLVGPRPHANTHNEAYRALIRGYMLRHKVKPGITGLAQVSGWRGETDTLEKMQKRIECDHRYIREWSLWMDITILLRTVAVVFSKQNAY